jgi:1-phosphatidylinositol phosphodiesterase
MTGKSISIPRSISTLSVFVLAFFLALVNCSKMDNTGSGHLAPLQGIDKCVLSVSTGGINKEWNINDDGFTEGNQLIFKEKEGSNWFIFRYDQLLTDGSYTIQNVQSQLYLSLEGLSSAENSRIVQVTLQNIYEDNPAAYECQRWKLIPKEDGTHILVNRYSGRVLELANSGIPDAAFIKQGAPFADVQSHSGWNLYPPRQYNDNNWMSRIDGNKLLPRINIPGTHDSGTMHNSCPLDEAKCQDLMPYDQLLAGGRILDLRLHYHHGIPGPDAFMIRHDICHCYTSSSRGTGSEMNFDYVLDDCINFLNQNPTETIILLIKQNSDSTETTAFSTLITSKRYLNNSKYGGRIYLGESIPDLDTVRGKIVWVRRYVRYEPQYHSEGINLEKWNAQNSYFTYGIINGITVKIQDAYNYLTKDVEGKLDMFDRAARDSTANPEYLVLNLTSAVGGPTSIQPHPKAIADIINPALIASSYFRYGYNYD